MQIKVKETRLHKLSVSEDPKNSWSDVKYEVLVAEAKLVLIEENLLTIPSIKVNGKIVKPILISNREDRRR